MIYLITNRNLVSNERYFEVMEEASFNGVERIIIREKDLNADELEVLYYKIEKVVSKETKLIINSNIECARRVNAYGIHLPFENFLSYENKDGFVVGVSIHSIEEGIRAYELGANYIMASNIYETKCKAGIKGKGIEFLLDLKKYVEIPIIALGGINENNISEVYNTNIKDIGIMSGLLLSTEIKRTIEKISNI